MDYIYIYGYAHLSIIDKYHFKYPYELKLRRYPHIALYVLRVKGLVDFHHKYLAVIKKHKYLAPTGSPGCQLS